MVGVTLSKRLRNASPPASIRQRPPPLFVRSVSRAGRYCDGQGLYLEVRPLRQPGLDPGASPSEAAAPSSDWADSPWSR